MKRYSHILTFLIIGSVITALSSCQKDYSDVSPESTYMDNNHAYLKIIDLSPNFASITGGSDTFNILVNGQKISGYTLSYNTLFPYSVNPTTATYTTTYAMVPIGTNKIQLANGVNKLDSVVYATLTENMIGGGRYSLLITDSILNGSKDSSKMFIRDNYTDNSVLPSNLPITSYITLRFGNLVLNDTGSVDLFSYTRNAALYTNIKPDSISAYQSIGYNYSPAATDTLYVLRSLPTGTKAPPLSQRVIYAKIAFSAITGTNITPVGRTFTILYKGDIHQTDTKAPGIITYIQ